MPKICPRSWEWRAAVRRVVCAMEPPRSQNPVWLSISVGLMQGLAHMSLFMAQKRQSAKSTVVSIRHGLSVWQSPG
ncbi:hypothetical protein AA0535_0838 [Asaia krungthepensis NRIC 0535]|uniref:HIG1 domain-containing protein n=1 Tax=Asaia krungthepensis NRIC 0535 TaxID=1307925 RepID=A0ABQ0PZZ4_9PROT|nr:hypothetical protein AA0535_0838 [Asaia krungthepensis NRIC 0535]